MADTLKLEIVTPDKLVVDETVKEVQVPGRNGYMGILPGHAPLISELSVGEITYHTTGGATNHIAVAWGFAEVLSDKVTILAETAERPEQIDVERAKRALERAQKRLGETAADTDFERAQNAMMRAQTRLKVAASAGRTDLAHLVP